MGLLTRLLTLPLRGPSDGVLWIAGQIASHAEASRNSPAALRAALSEAESRLLSGEIDEDTYDAIEEELLLRLSRTTGQT